MKILVLPKDSNPYQELLYGNMVPKVEYKYITWPVNKISTFIFMPTILLKLVFYRAKGYKILHLHWTYGFTYDKRIPFHYALTSINNYLFLLSLRILGIKLVWTAHNLKPHEKESLNDIAIVRKITEQASLVIAHSQGTVNEMRTYGYNTAKTIVVPHGSFNSTYKSTYSSAEARKELSIGNDEFVILFFGIVRPYKGLDDLLSAFRDLKNTNLRLVIAGKCEDQTLLGKINSLSKGLNVNIYNEFVPDHDVAMYFKASNLVCLPFKRVTTSGSVLLAMTFSKAVVAPSLGAFTELPVGAAYLYDPAKKNGLAIALKDLISDVTLRNKIAKRGNAYSKTLDWTSISSKTLQLYKDVLR